VRDSVVHLAYADDLAHEYASDGPGELAASVAAALSSGDVAAFEVQMKARGRAMSPRAVLEWWRSSGARLRDVLRGLDARARLPWGPMEMSARSFATARLMETWAHGLDCFAAASVEPMDTDRLRHVAWLSVRALPYAFASPGLDPPGAVRLSLVLPSGARWTSGSDGAPTVITGTASDWCRVAVRRDRADERSRLHATGPDAEAILTHVRAYL
jgi:uncharacterized protein (TIGR03084 family)